MKPIIGISVDILHDATNPSAMRKLALNWDYAQAIVDAGGIPILIPPMSDMRTIAKMIHGWLIPGGDDIDAHQFGEENHPEVKLQDPARFEGEQALLREIDAELPVLGICYGCQFLNVARGGTLIQHLPDVVETVHTGGPLQSYNLAESRLSDAAGTRSIDGKSFHHQAVKDLGSNLDVVAQAQDGTIEAVEATDRPWMIGVQWHPERTPEDSATQRLFRSFVAAAAAYADTHSLAKAR